MKKFEIENFPNFREKRKLLRIMKLTLLFLTACFIQVSATVYSQNTKFTFDVKNKRVVDILRDMEDQSEFRFFYQREQVNVERKIDLDITDQTVENVLTHLFSEEGIEFQVRNDNLILLKPAGMKFGTIEFLAENGQQQQPAVSGTVTDETGQPLPGVNVVVKGTTQGTITNADGEYSITSITEDATLVFSFVGMRTQEIEVGNQSTVDVTMDVDAIGIEEVVAIGYGTIKKKDVTGAVASVKGEDIVDVGSFNVGDALQGKLSGVMVTQAGDVSSDPKIRIRGINTIGGNNDPTIIIDNPTSGLTLNDINPADIVSIDVLKDASSSAIFGINASNGVILITTKKGKYGAKYTNIEVNVSSGFSYLPRQYNLLNASELVDVIDLARANQNAMGGGYKLYDEIWPNNDFGRQDLTDWQDEYYKNGYQQDYNVSVRGGSENAIYGLSLSYQDIDGIASGNEAYRYTARLNFETKAINDLINIGANFNFSTRDQRGIRGLNNWSSSLLRAATLPPSMPTHNEDGKPYIERDPLVTEYFYAYKTSRMYNYVEIFNEQSNPRNNFNMELYGNFDIIQGMKVESRFGYRINNNYGRNFTTNIGNPMSAASSLNVSSGQTRAYTLQNTLTYNKIFGEHRIDAVAGFTVDESTFNLVNASRSSFPPSEADALKYLGFGDPASAANDENFNNHRTNSYFARVNYSLMGKYLLTATVRRDGDAYFHPDVRWGTFPSASFGWIISEEGFMNNLEWLDLLKIRVGTGEVGRALDNYAYLSEVASGYLTPQGQGATDYYFGGFRNTGKVITLQGNKNLTWETTRMTNYGLDFGVKNISGSVEYFNNTTFDILLKGQIPDIAGITYGQARQAPFVNAGEVKTHGVDFNLNYIKSLGDFNLSVGVNGAYSVNEVTDLYQQEYIGEEANLSFLGGVTTMNRTYVGEPIGSYHGFRWDGIFNSTEEVAEANQNARNIALQNNPNLSESELNNIYYISPNTAPGDYKFKDLNGDGQITDSDKENLGSGNPPFTYGINFSSDYKGFDLTMNFTGVAGNKIHAVIEPVFLNPSSFNSFKDILNYWSLDNENTNVPRLTISDPNFNYRVSDRWLYNGAYLRCQNLIVGYTLSQSITGDIFEKVRIYANIKNLFTITDYPFLDPEVKGSLTGAPDIDMGAGVDIGSMPLPRTFIFGVNVNF